MNAARDTVFARWHKMLRLAHHERSWYRDRLREELEEQRRAITCYTASERPPMFSSRSAEPATTTFPSAACPLSPSRNMALSMRICLRSTVCADPSTRPRHSFDAPRYRSVGEVVNPNKDEKLVGLACRHKIDSTQSTGVGRALRRVWPLLPEMCTVEAPTVSCLPRSAQSRAIGDGAAASW